MDILLSNALLGGYLSNETYNAITGELQLAGLKRPIRVELTGNFLRDVAGCRIDFVNPVPKIELQQVAMLHHLQTGIGGEMTASRRIQRSPKRHAPPLSPALTTSAAGLKNILFLEWFNDHDQRVLIQAWHWNLRVGEARWHLSKEEESEQLSSIRAIRRVFLLSRRD